MRRSFAPSIHTKRCISSKPLSKDDTGRIQNSTRSTSSILSLLNENTRTCNSNLDSSNCQVNADLILSPNNSKNAPVSTRNEDLECSLSEVTEAGNATLLPALDNNYAEKRMYNVLWGKLSKKKHKTWEGDGVVEVSLHSVLLKDSEGKFLGMKRGVKTDVLEEGSRLVIGSKEVELIDLIADKTKEETEEKEKQKPPSIRDSSSVTRPSKRPRFMSSQLENARQNIPQDALVMSTPSAEHQKTSITASSEDDLFDELFTI